MTKFAYFGSSIISVHVLDELERFGHVPSLIVTTPDKPVGRKLVMTPNPVKVWGNARSIPVLDPAKLDNAFVSALSDLMKPAASSEGTGISLFIVMSYGKIIPQAVLDLPKHKTLNIHPSILPKYRGASPIKSAILDDAKDTGVTIMRIDAEMDHGPIVAQREVHISEWLINEEMEKLMAHEGAELLASVIEPWAAGKIPEIEQDHAAATFTKKFAKEDAEIRESDIADRPYETFRKIQAFHDWPSVYFFAENKSADGSIAKTRVKITAAAYSKENDALTIERVIPEGRSEMPYSQFLAGRTI
ncbi:MAG: methionyl-tRNA formyltransferase, methionyl-tRNA formyltransferase [Candidatus Taylorbacteria bacterium]|nr:methionyl-tRNA formyltransferase, methionyl-tRNA formyltransferase [Candidatus Taylorbacteria bacterium]